jgi:hypothetical protein
LRRLSRASRSASSHTDEAVFASVRDLAFTLWILFLASFYLHRSISSTCMPRSV